MFDIYSLLKNISKSKLKFKDKPCISSSLLQFTSVKNRYLSNFIRLKDPSKKRKLKQNTKNTEIFYRFFKKRKQFHSSRFFPENINDLIKVHRKE